MNVDYVEAQDDCAGSPAMTPRDVLTIARRRKWSLIAPFIGATVIALVMALSLPAKYRSKATILIEEQEIPADFVMATVTSFAEQRLQQINQRLMSTTNLEEIIKRFDLYQKMRAKRTSEEVIAQMRKDVHLKQISTEVMDRRTGRPTVATIAFSLSYEGEDSPETVQKVANVLVSLFLKGNLEVRERQTAETSQFLETEMERVRKELQTVELALSEFKEKHINELPELLQVNIQGLSNCERRIERLEEQLRSIKEREGYLQTQLANLSPFLENSDRQRLQALETELVTLKARYSDDHPDVGKITDEISALREKLSFDSRQMDNAPNEPDNPAYITLASQLAGNRAEIETIHQQLKAYREYKILYETRIENSPKVEREYIELTGRQINIREKHNDLMRKHMEAKVAHGLEKGQKGERFTLIDPPRLPEKPFKPNRSAIIIGGVILGLIVGAGWSALREFTDQCVRSENRLSASTGFPVLGQVPHILSKSDRRRIVTRRLASGTATVLVVIVGVTAFHFLVMDLNVLWAKIDRKIIMP
jgi:polysaccharide chain length determinant protein (PEP-CTERM system associated)